MSFDLNLWALRSLVPRHLQKRESPVCSVELQPAAAPAFGVGVGVGGGGGGGVRGTSVLARPSRRVRRGRDVHASGVGGSAGPCALGWWW